MNPSVVSRMKITQQVILQQDLAGVLRNRGVSAVILLTLFVNLVDRQYVLSEIQRISFPVHIIENNLVNAKISCAKLHPIIVLRKGGSCPRTYQYTSSHKLTVSINFIVVYIPWHRNIYIYIQDTCFDSDKTRQ